MDSTAEGVLHACNFLDSGAGGKMHPTPIGSRGIGGIQVGGSVGYFGHPGHDVKEHRVSSSVVNRGFVTISIF